jgi:hypothetical protein
MAGLRRILAVTTPLPRPKKLTSDIKGSPKFGELRETHLVRFLADFLQYP